MATSSLNDARARPLTGEVAEASNLPAWPLFILFVPYMLWWALGLADFIWLIAAVIMLGLLAQTRGVTVPRGFGVWLLFLVWMLASSIMVDTANNMVEFVYRAAQYLACTVLFVYVYNGRRTMGARRVCGLLTVYWLWTVFGGVLGSLFPEQRLKTPTFYLLRFLPGDLGSIGFINDMVIRRFAQFNPDSYLGVAPRPSAPFLYANNWGSVYSLLLPFVIAYVIQVRGTPRFWLLAPVIPLSMVLAFLTLNRGMLIGVGLAGIYVAVRLALRGRIAAVAVILVSAVVGALVFETVAASRLETRLEGPSTTTRASLYTRSLELVPGSPVFGYGVPVQTVDPDQPPIGTQGQFWMLLVSHGPMATALFVGWFLIAFWQARRLWDLVGITAATVLLVSVVELGYYGVVPYGLPVMMLAAALGMRTRPTVPRSDVKASGRQ